MEWLSPTVVVKVEDLIDREGAWKSLSNLRSRRSYHHVGDGVMETLLDYALQFDGAEDIPLSGCNGWEWGSWEIEFKGLAISTSQIESLYPDPIQDVSTLNRQWAQFEPEQGWKVGWWKLWTGFCHNLYL